MPVNLKSFLNFKGSKLKDCPGLVCRIEKNCFKGAAKLYFMRYLCVVIILLITYLYKSASSTYSFKKLVFCFSVLCVLFRFVLNSRSAV